MKTIKKDKLFQNILILFLIIQPIFDLKIFYNSISTLIRVIIIGILFLIYFFQDKNKKKYLLAIYPIIILIYFIFHDLNAQNFKSLVPGDFNYSTVKEALYIIKMICPFLLIYDIYRAKLSKEQIIKVIECILIIMSLIIIITNIFKFSYGTYSDERIKANFFSWFNNTEYTYKDLCSKGLFEYANQISAILVMFLPFTIYQCIKSKSIKNNIIVLINIFSLMLIGTKVAVIGIGIVAIYTTFVILIFDRDNIKSNICNSIPFAIIIIFYAFCLPFNPTFSRMEETKNVMNNIAEGVNYNNLVNEEELSDVETINSEQEKENSKYDYIIDNYAQNQINYNFLTNCYPYQYDVDFWYNIISNENVKKSDYRFLEKSMIKRVVEINDNKNDKLFGITNVRVQNIFNIEQDFIVQYYSLGIVGLILVFIPYFTVSGIYISNIIKEKLKLIDCIELLSLITIMFIFAISVFSGNLLNSLSFTIYFSFLFLQLINNNDTNTQNCSSY